MEDELTKLTRELLDLKAEKKKEMKNYSDLIKAKEKEIEDLVRGNQ